jgi:hypothetical protein
MALRKQFHFRPSTNGYFAWDVERLIQLSKSLPIQKMAILKIQELDEPYWYGNPKTDVPTVRSIFEHIQLAMAADLSFPVILSSNGRVMDGMHRVIKALMDGQETINAVQFEIDPQPDHVDVHPDQLDCR